MACVTTLCWEAPQVAAVHLADGRKKIEVVVVLVVVVVVVVVVIVVVVVGRRW